VTPFFDTNIVVYALLDVAKRQRDWADIERAVSVLRTRFARNHGLAFYDALIVATAIEAGCDTLYTEDMQHGRAIGGLAIVNPFRESAR
jgi:predicted nucleic acid-binding protein